MQASVNFAVEFEDGMGGRGCMRRHSEVETTACVDARLMGNQPYVDDCCAASRAGSGSVVTAAFTVAAAKVIDSWYRHGSGTSGQGYPWASIQTCK